MSGLTHEKGVEASDYNKEKKNYKNALNLSICPQYISSNVWV